jgi:hypothetical protein
VPPNGVDQQSEIDWLPDNFHSLELVRFAKSLRHRREKHDGYCREVRIGERELSATELLPRHDGHHQVEQYHTRARLSETVGPPLSVLRRHNREPLGRD